MDDELGACSSESVVAASPGDGDTAESPAGDSIPADSPGDSASATAAKAAKESSAAGSRSDKAYVMAKEREVIHTQQHLQCSIKHNQL